MATDAVSNDATFVVSLEIPPSVDHLVTEDGAPVDGFFSEKQMRLLTESLLSSWSGPGGTRPFAVMANVGLFYNSKRPPLVPDVMLSVDVQLPDNLLPKKARSYFVWQYRKLPEVVIEIVSNNEGGEDSTKFAAYARIGVLYYVIFDPEFLLSDDLLKVFRLVEGEYQPMTDPIRFPEIELGLQLWKGSHEKYDATWIRWNDLAGKLIPTGYERAETESQRAEAASERAEAESHRAEAASERAESASKRAEAASRRAEAEAQRAERLAEILRKLGYKPNGN